MHRLKFNVAPHTFVYGIGIYAIVCIPTGKLYIGQTRKCFLYRWLEHQCALLNNKHNPYFMNAFKKYGIENFECKVLEYIDFYDEKLFNEHETKWIKHFRKKYGIKHVFNSNDGGTGCNPTEERRQQMREHSKHMMNLPEHRYRGRDSFRKWLEQPGNRDAFKKMQKERGNTPEERKARSERMSEYWASQERRDVMSNTQKEHYKLHPERKTKQSEAQKKTWKDPEIRKKRIDAIKKTNSLKPKRKKYKKKTPEEIARNKEIAKEKQRIAREKYIHTPEYIEKQRLAQNKRFEDPEKLAIAIEAQLRTAKARKEKNDKLRTIADMILYLYYTNDPKAKRLPLKRKLMLINKLALGKHWFISFV